MSLRKLAAGVALTALAGMTASAVYAQDITGSLQGRVLDGSAPVPSATVVIVHQPTGTRATAVTAADGSYNARGLRVGGPYTVTVTSKGRSVSDQVANLAVGETTTLDLSFSAPARVAEVTVQAARAARPQPGLSTAFNAAAIVNTPTINRDLKDVVRINPFATIDPSNQDALSFAGANNRFNQITVDSVRQNDDFGLNNNGYPTQRTPISLEAIQGLQVSVAPYSVVNDGFLGGNVNVVTKSGSNAFHGSAYLDYDSDRIRGGKINGLPAGGRLLERTYGATLGGPVIKDRVFFFFSYEKYQGNFTIDEGPTGSGRANVVPRISIDALNTFQAGTKAAYGYDPGNWVDTNPPVEDAKYFGKVDVNLTENHRLSATYQDTHGTSFNGASVNPFVGGESLTTPRVGLTTQQYVKDEHLTAYNFTLNSSWTPNFSTEARLGHKETDTLRVVPGLSVGETTVTVTDLPGVSSGTGTPAIRFGTEINSQPNYLNTFNDTFEGIARYSLGTHRLQGGVRREHQDITNIFGRQYLGSYGFSSYANFLARRASSFSLTGAVPAGSVGVPAAYNTSAQSAANLNFDLNSIYVEDTWQATPELSVLYGVRYNWFGQENRPILNPNFVSRNGFENTANLDGRNIVLPRIYAKYRPAFLADRADFEVGYGRFSAQGLGVWIENPWANDGVRQVNAVCPTLGTGQFYNNVDLTAPPAGCTFTSGNGNVNAIDPNLKIPSAWKFNVSAGYNFDLPYLGDGWRVQVDYLNTKNQDALVQYDLRAVQTGVAPDGRPIYGRKTNGVVGANLFDMVLTNVGNGGGSDSVAASLSHAWDQGWARGLAFNGSYTYTHATDVNPMTSSIADSSYVRFATDDPQRPRLATSDYEIRDKYQLNVSYSRRFFADLATVFTIYAQQRSGVPFSYTFDNTRNTSTNRDAVFGYLVSQTYSGTQATSNALYYVPAAAGGVVTATSDPRVTYASGFDLGAFNSYLQNTGLIKYAGQIAPRNAFREKSWGTIDLHVSQELPAFVPRGSKLQVYFDIKNLGNLINNKWGVLQQHDFYRGVPVNAVSINNAGQYVYSSLRTQTGTTDRPIPALNVNSGSLWLARFGVKYSF